MNWKDILMLEEEDYGKPILLRSIANGKTDYHLIRSIGKLDLDSIMELMQHVDCVQFIRILEIL